MYVARLELTDFRSYSSLELHLEAGVSAFVGPNGAGKTNLVEAVCYAATQGSHRVATDAPLVRSGAERAVVRTEVMRADRRALIEIEINPGKANRARVNRAPVSRARDVLGLLRCVLFAPEDLALVKGDPAERRRYLDELLVAKTPRMAAVRADYERVLKQRNALLKTAHAGGFTPRKPPKETEGTDFGGYAGGKAPHGYEMLGTLDVWDSHLARAGAELLAGRLQLVTALRPLVVKAYAALAPGHIELEYRSSLGADIELQADREGLVTAIQAGLTAARKSELERGISLVGPHRDDLTLGLADLPARGYASHGEAWSYALALKLAAFELLRGEGTDPVLILDDVFAELDTHRRARLAEFVAPAEQVLITAAVPGAVPEELSGARFELTEGRPNRVR